ncbi:glutamate decarboxylase [Zalerion maritima]|uniref:Glutamate decarboxylase n=1 Tax=Zalerion maritima TaxID=339359 RepID=A0AAD5RX08_9PEZI|nr:glutamate decarboxylase [Zalerion maritima]
MATNGYAPRTNGTHEPADFPDRAAEVQDLITAVRDLIVPYVKSADEAAATKITGQSVSTAKGLPQNGLVELHRPEDLIQKMRFSLPLKEGRGREGLLDTIQDVLKYSVNTWDQGFLDKLYASTNAVGVISEMILATLNTNLHVYQVSPALTVIEKHTTKIMADLWGFTGPRAGGVSTQGGSASNLTSIVVARNTLFPETKTKGNGDNDFILLTSAHGHYSIEKAAQMCGMGSDAVWDVAIDDTGRMIPEDLRKQIKKAKEDGKTPFYVNATAGTTVMGSYDPFVEIREVCTEFGLWMHIDASWGGPALFSAKQKHKLKGCELANSLAVNPHKMMNVPVTCSFLLGPDINTFHKANTLPAGYLFHGAGDEDREIWDLADLTLQCGRRGDSLKLALSWIYYGAAGFERQVDNAFEMAGYLAGVLTERRDFVLVSTNPPPCLQVCFYHAPGGVVSEEKDDNTTRTRAIADGLIRRGFMVDYAPGPKGSMFRVVVNCQTRKGTVDGLVKALEEVAGEVQDRCLPH